MPIKFLRYILKYIIFFLIYLGLSFLIQELTNLFGYDALLRNAGLTTIVLMLVDLITFLFKNFTKKEGQ